MEIYEKQDQNDIIILKKLSIDLTKYNVENLENGDKKLIPKVDEIKSIDEIKQFNFKNSKIIECEVNNYIITITKYKNVLNYVYDVIDNGAKIIKTSILNIDTKKRNDSGYYYLDNLGISVQGVDSNKCMLEIISQCLCYNIKIMMKIQLENNKLVNISF
jgi:hypothetical protein